MAFRWLLVVYSVGRDPIEKQFSCASDIVQSLYSLTRTKIDEESHADNESFELKKNLFALFTGMSLLLCAH